MCSSHILYIQKAFRTKAVNHRTTYAFKWQTNAKKIKANKQNMYNIFASINSKQIANGLFKNVSELQKVWQIQMQYLMKVLL